MPQNWREYLAEKEKLADQQQQAQFQPTPAARLVFYWSAIYPHWRIDSVVVRKLDEIFDHNDFFGMNEFFYHYNYLVAAIAKDMREEIALRLAVENKELTLEQYKQAWWAEKPLDKTSLL